ncbi:hypothetical protein GIB67_021177 [Kingdonia uniflora]|uniref:Uncharacterized protein n=1 Tax=Kingdonia uniflora TaxID=39325 RepID=A0A7J7N808_9MAGN|nr:hypothetical protein GIB67_021177 [Kingdonia uniflora]
MGAGLVSTVTATFIGDGSDRCDARANQCTVLSDEVVVYLVLLRPCVSEVKGFIL